MTVKIVTDSASDLPHEVAQQLGITVIPLNVRFGEEVYRNGIDLTSEEFYTKLAHNENFPFSSVPTLGAYAEAYDKLAEETDEILVITLTSKLSGTYEVALQAVDQMRRKCRVKVIDSLTAVMAQGLIAIAAAKAAQAGASLEKVIDLTRHNIPRATMRFAFDTLKYLRRGGRIGAAQAFLGSMLRVNPIIGTKDGEVFPFARERSRAKAIDYLYNFVISHSRIDGLAVEDADVPDEAQALAERLGSKFPGEHIYRAKISPVVGTHVGPRALGVSVLGDR
jgi:DegV family protein with EDD domain